MQYWMNVEQFKISALEYTFKEFGPSLLTPKNTLAPPLNLPRQLIETHTHIHTRSARYTQQRLHCALD